ncbi:hypothetical protein [Kribbella solani]|uniref:hypothetical protein n=1 Tax=Kribbella solani TaxID=236067 RepID=UPI0029BD995F|nr:hypothetical protein [Kribbella solani]MDX2970769.1 hypothetical protein [Kribbella solani]
MIITAASFPTPDLIKRVNNPAVWDQQGRFASLQAAAANSALTRMSTLLDAAATKAQRMQLFADTYRDLAEWRYQLARRDEGEQLGTTADLCRTRIGRGYVLDPFGAAHLFGEDPSAPGSRLSARLGNFIRMRLETESPGAAELQNIVVRPDGSTIGGNFLIRGELAHEYGFPGHYAGTFCTVTGELADRTTLQRDAFGLVAELEEQRAAGRTDLLDDPEAQQAFRTAQYYLYQGPEYRRGSDATLRVLQATLHTRVFGAPPALPQDIDVVAYVAGQQTFDDYLKRNQSILQPAPDPTTTGTLDRPSQETQHQRNGGLERG